MRSDRESFVEPHLTIDDERSVAILIDRLSNKPGGGMHSADSPSVALRPSGYLGLICVRAAGRATRKRRTARFRIVVCSATPDELRTGHDDLAFVMWTKRTRVSTPLDPIADPHQR